MLNVQQTLICFYVCHMKTMLLNPAGYFPTPCSPIHITRWLIKLSTNALNTHSRTQTHDKRRNLPPTRRGNLINVSSELVTACLTICFEFNASGMFGERRRMAKVFVFVPPLPVEENGKQKTKHTHPPAKSTSTFRTTTLDSVDRFEIEAPCAGERAVVARHRRDCGCLNQPT